MAATLDQLAKLAETHGINFDVNKSTLKPESMGVIGDMNRFQQFQMGEAMTIAAANPGGGAGEGMGLGMGFAMANNMAQNMGKVMPGGGAMPPASPQTRASYTS